MQMRSTSANQYIRPGVRKEMIDRPARFQSNRFWNLFTRSFRLQWPQKLSDTCIADSTPNMMRISDEFTSRSFDLEFYRLTKDFLDEYPEMRAHAKQFEASPAFPISQNFPLHCRQDPVNSANSSIPSTDERRRGARGKKRVQRECWTSDL